MNDVFISYSRRDKVFTQKLYEALKAVDRIVWADWDSIPAASDWDAEIKQGIQETNSVLFVLSPEWIKSNECRKEMVHAVAMGKRLFPILYLPVDPNDVPPELAKINWVYMRDTDDFDKAFQTLCSAMDTDLDWIKTHTRIQVRALEWERKNRSASFALRGEDLTEGEKFVASGANKSPVPTQLQSEYILASRNDATWRQRQTLAGVTVALVISIALGAAAVIQWRAAKTQAQIALARQLVAQAQSINATRNSKQNVAVLLSLQSLKLFSSTDASNLLINNDFSGHQTKLLQNDVAVKVTALSHNGKYIAGAGGCIEVNPQANCTSEIIIWEIESDKKIAILPHNDVVNSIAFSPDGKYLISGSADDTAQLWNIETKEIVFKIQHNGDVLATAFSGDGRFVASGSEDGHLSVWDVEKRTRSLHVFLNGQTPTVGSLAFSPDNKYIAAAGTCDKYSSLGYCEKGLVGIWDITNQQEVTEIILDDVVMSSVSFSPDGKYLLAGTFNKTVRLWNIATGEEIALFNTNGIVWQAVFSPDGKYILAGSDNTARVWEIASKKEVSHMTHDGQVFSVAFSPDGKLALSGSEDSTARLWRVSDSEEIARITHDEGGMSSSVYSVAFTPDGKYAISAGADKTIRIWETTSFDKAVAIENHQSGIQVFLTPNGKYLFSRNNDNAFCVWEVSDGRQIKCSNHDMISDPIFSLDGKRILSMGQDYLWHIWEIASGNEITLKNQDSFLSYVAFSPDGKYVAASTDGLICTWASSTGEQVKCISLSDNLFIHSIAFSADDKHILSGGVDGTLCIWDISGEKQVKCINHKDSVNYAEYSSDGMDVYFGDNQNACRWELVSDKQTCLYLNHDDTLTSFKFSPDGLYVASASWDGTVRVWETSSGKEIAHKIHDGVVWSVTFGSDRNYIISASGTGIVRKWLWKQNDLIEDACARVLRNLTRAEWTQYIGDAMPYPAKQKDATCPNLPIEPETPPIPKVTP